MKYTAGVSIEGEPFYSVVGQTGLVVAMRVTSLEMAERIARLLEADDKLATLDWQAAESYLTRSSEAYAKLRGMQGVNVDFALGALIELRVRFDKGERSREIYEAIMEFQ
jgi:hypothetical protein